MTTQLNELDLLDRDQLEKLSAHWISTAEDFFSQCRIEDGHHKLASILDCSEQEVIEIEQQLQSLIPLSLAPYQEGGHKLGYLGDKPPGESDGGQDSDE